MLILTRKVGQEINIGDNISIIVHSIEKNRVRLGCKGDEKTNFRRAEKDDKRNNKT